jgi:hypothetical protein
VIANAIDLHRIVINEQSLDGGKSEKIENQKSKMGEARKRQQKKGVIERREDNRRENKMNGYKRKFEKARRVGGCVQVLYGQTKGHVSVRMGHISIWCCMAEGPVWLCEGSVWLWQQGREGGKGRDKPDLHQKPPFLFL